MELTELESAARLVVAEEETRKHRLTVANNRDDDDDSDDSDSENPSKESGVTNVKKSDAECRIARENSDDSDSEDSSSDSESSDSDSSSSDASSVISVKENIDNRVSETDNKVSQEEIDKKATEEIDVLESHFNEINLKSEKDLPPNENETDHQEIEKSPEVLSKTFESINLS